VISTWHICVNVSTAQLWDIYLMAKIMLIFVRIYPIYNVIHKQPCTSQTCNISPYKTATSTFTSFMIVQYMLPLWWGKTASDECANHLWIIPLVIRSMQSRHAICKAQTWLAILTSISFTLCITYRRHWWCHHREQRSIAVQLNNGNDRISRGIHLVQS